MVNLTDLLQGQNTLEQEMKRYRRLKEQRFELLQLREELYIQPDAEDIKFIASLNESIANIEKRMAETVQKIKEEKTKTDHKQ